MKITWNDAGREPQSPSDPDFPKGVDVDVSKGSAVTCSTDLPYPARRCGHYIVSCEVCGTLVILTTAGRPDDPRSVKLSCRGTRQ